MRSLAAVAVLVLIDERIVLIGRCIVVLPNRGGGVAPPASMPSVRQR